MTGSKLLLILFCSPLCAQRSQEPGHPIGAVSTKGDLIIMKLNEGVLGRPNLFDLDHHTLRFTPKDDGYMVENLALQWDGEFGPEVTAPQLSLHQFAFPFSGKTWDSLSIGLTGSIRFGPAPDDGGGGRGPGGRGGGVSIGRFDQLQDAVRRLVNTVPAICVFFKPRMSGHRYAKELDDRLVVTWDLTEPFGGIQDFTWTATVNRFQAVLRRDGSIDMSYNQIAAADAIVGVYPVIPGGEERPLATLTGDEHPAIAAHLDIRSVRISVVRGVLLKVTLETRGPVLTEGDPALEGVRYRVHFDAPKAIRKGSTDTLEAVWTIRGTGGRRAASRYFASGPGVSRGVKSEANAISIQGMLPPSFNGLASVAVSADTVAGTSAEVAGVVAAQPVKLSGWRNPEVHLSNLKLQDGPYPIVFEAFHYVALPNPRDLTCTVIRSLGDKFDFLAYYSEFRVDNQEAGTPSNGPLGGGVTGVGQTQQDLEGYCSAGRFQWQYEQPVNLRANQAQERPPEGAAAVNPREVGFYAPRSPDGKISPYNYGISQIAHEMGHRWSAFVAAQVAGERIVLGPTHWARGLQAPAAFPYLRPTEASIMGGGVWQDNFDGTYTQLDDDYYVPATGWSHLDLYLMGLIAPEEVPDWFLLRNLVAAGRDGASRAVFKADRVKVTIQDVIAAEGPRLPARDHAQKKFNTGMVILVEHGRAPTREGLARVNGIRERWIDYWSTTTGRRAAMTASPR